MHTCGGMHTVYMWVYNESTGPTPSRNAVLSEFIELDFIALKGQKLK